MTGPALRVETFSMTDRPDLVRRCQQLRYAVYHHDLGLDTPDMDHALGVDVEENDPHADFIAVMTEADGEILGCMRLQREGGTRFYAELEFELVDPWFRDLRCVEAARFAVRRQHRDGPVAVLLFTAFREFCRRHDVSHLLSVIIVPDPERSVPFARALSEWLGPRVEHATHRARPQPAYTVPELEHAAPPGDAVAPERLPAMLRMLAIPRTTLCSVPAYCNRFKTWNFLLVTRLH